MLPYTLIKQLCFFRLRRKPSGVPDFLCIGTQKSGTTWLYKQLDQHPSVCMAKPKEVHYFDWYFYRSVNWYLSHFKCERGKLQGEITPGYSIIEKGRVHFIRRIMPDVKLIVLLRDPRERAWSSARFHFGKQLQRDLSKVATDEFIAHFKEQWVRDRGDYETIWKKWTSVFPREQFLVLFTEEMELDPQTVLDRCSTFLGLEKFTAHSVTERFNESESFPMPDEVRNHLNSQYQQMIASMPTWLGMENTYWNN